MMKSQSLRLGVTLHSFTNEYCAFQWSFEDMMQLAGVLGGGVEIVGPAHHRCFPEVSDEFERVFKSSVERNELIPTCYGTYADPFMLPDRDLNHDELTEYTLLQLKGAVKLGFPVARLQYFAAPIAERVLPFAERHRLKLGYELHTPLTIESDRTQALIAQIERIGSPYLGLIPDAGLFTRSVPKFIVDGARQRGVPEHLITQALQLWQAKAPVEEAQAVLKAQGADARIFGILERIWGSFGHSEPVALAQIEQHIIHVHGKFFSIENGDEPDVRYEEFIQALLDIGYQGWISSEYEGPDTDSYAVVKAHQQMIERYVKKHGEGASATSRILDFGM